MAGNFPWGMLGPFTGFNAPVQNPSPSVIILQAPGPADGQQQQGYNTGGNGGAWRNNGGGRGSYRYSPYNNGGGGNGGGRGGGRGGRRGGYNNNRGGGQPGGGGGRGGGRGRGGGQPRHIPQERMRSVIDIHGNMKPLCADYSQSGGACTRGALCPYSHASKEQRFCLSYFDKQEHGVGYGCTRGEQCLFGHGDVSRQVYMAYRANHPAHAALDDGQRNANAMQLDAAH